jgi:hypothetical protein
MTWRRAFHPEPIGPDTQQSGFVRAVVATAEKSQRNPAHERAAAW